MERFPQNTKDTMVSKETVCDKNQNQSATHTFKFLGWSSKTEIACFFAFSKWFLYLLINYLSNRCHASQPVFTWVSAAALIKFFMSPVRLLFEGGVYLKVSYHNGKTFWLYNFIYFMTIFSWLTDLKLIKVLAFMTASSIFFGKLTITSLDVNPDCCWKFTRSDTRCSLSVYSVLLLFYECTRISGAPELRHHFSRAVHNIFSVPCAALNPIQTFDAISQKL